MITQEQLKEILRYDPESGNLYWINPVGKKKPLGYGIAGGLNDNGYIKIGINYRMYRAHRLAWLYMTGEWPKDQVDHINGIRTDNRWLNLREASSSMNNQNKRGPQSNNKSGYLGVSWSKHSKKWVAFIKSNGRQRSLGLFETPELAYEAYLCAKRSEHEACTI